MFLFLVLVLDRYILLSLMIEFVIGWVFWVVDFEMISMWYLGCF